MGRRRQMRFRRHGLFALMLWCLLLAACGQTTKPAVTTHGAATALPTTTPTAQVWPTAQAPTMPGWIMQWDDEFDGDTLNPQHWTIADSATSSYLGCCLYFGTQAWTPSALVVRDGLLHIQTKQANLAGYHYTSGAISTEYTYAFLYGRIDVRIRMPHSTSLWPALWLIPADTRGQKIATYEIDFAEAWESDPHTVYAFFHTGYNQTYCQAQGPDFTAGYHVFSLVWTPTELQWLVDGQQQCTRVANIPNVPLSLIIDTAIGGDNEPIDQSTVLPQSTEVDYVRIWTHQ